MSTRRDFLAHATLVAGSALLGAARAKATKPIDAGGISKPLRMLILGGTGFIGPHYVNAAVTRGHQVSVFNRGQRDPGLPANVERLVGDRNGDLSAITGRDWDAVLDLATYGPAWVRSLGEAVKGRVRHYTLISTVSVYDNPGKNRVTHERSRVLKLEADIDPYSITTPSEHYGALKVLCETEAMKYFPDGLLVLRPGYIVGPGDPKGALSYWPVRMAKGGSMLATGDPKESVQFIDVRDLAQWSIRLIERQTTGLYNAVGPTSSLKLDKVVATAGAMGSSSAKVNWVPSSVLATQKDRDLWSSLLFWSFESEGFASSMRMSNSKAVTHGLTTRPLIDTLTDAFTWYGRQPADAQTGYVTGAGIVTGKQLANGEWTKVTTPWSEYIEREGQILAGWKPVG